MAHEHAHAAAALAMAGTRSGRWSLGRWSRDRWSLGRWSLGAILGRWSLGASLGAILVLSGCAGGGHAVGDREQPDSVPQQAGDFNWVDLDTGRSCATSSVACGRGNCAANIANTCKVPVTCELTVQCVCEAYTGESGEALARAHETIGPGEKVGVLARVVCGDGEIVATHAKRVHCE